MSNESRKRKRIKTVNQLTKAVSNIKNIASATNMVKNVPDNDAFKIALLNNGVTEEYVATILKAAMEANTTKVEAKSGEVIVCPDNVTRLKAIEMWINVFGYKEQAKAAAQKPKEGDKHIHLHGISTEELDNALAAASIREDKKTGS